MPLAGAVHHIMVIRINRHRNLPLNTTLTKFQFWRLKIILLWGARLW
jgi:hypothetical protein